MKPDNVGGIAAFVCTCVAILIGTFFLIMQIIGWGHNDDRLP